MGIFLGFGFLGTRGFGSGLLRGFKIHREGCLSTILRDYTKTPKPRRGLIPPTGTPILLHPHLSIRDTPDLPALIKSHNPQEVGLKAIVNHRKGIAIAFNGVHGNGWFKPCEHQISFGVLTNNWKVCI